MTSKPYRIDPPAVRASRDAVEDARCALERHNRKWRCVRVLTYASTTFALLAGLLASLGQTTGATLGPLAATLGILATVGLVTAAASAALICETAPIEHPRQTLREAERRLRDQSDEP